MKIAMLTNNYKPFLAGVPVSVDRLCSGLRRMGHEVVVFAPSYPEQTEEYGVFRYRSLLQNVAGGAVIPNWLDPAIEQRFAEENFDLIHVHHPFAIGNTAVHFSQKYGIPLAFTYHTRYEQYLHYTNPFSYLPFNRQKRQPPKKDACHKEKLVAAYLRYFTGQCSHVFAPTEGIRQALQSYGCQVEISVLPTGLPAQMYEQKETEAAQIRAFYAAGRSYLFCTVARLAKEKNLSFLLQALARFRQEKGDCFTWLLLGAGPEREALETEASKLGLSSNVVFLGNCPNAQVPLYLQACDAFLFSSLTETQGIVLLEAMAAGIPVAAVYADGVKDIVSDGLNGVLSALNQEDFLAKLERLLQPAAYPLFREGAYQTADRYREEFIANSAATQYERIVSDYKFIQKCGKLTKEVSHHTTKGALLWKRITF